MLPGSSLGELILEKLDQDPDNKFDEIKNLIKSNQSILEQRVKPTAGPVIPGPKQRVQSTAPHHLTVSTRATFTLVVDDIGIKYKHGSGEIKHLKKYWQNHFQNGM